MPSESELRNRITQRINDIDTQRGSLSAERVELRKLRSTLNLYRKRFIGLGGERPFTIQRAINSKNPYEISNINSILKNDLIKERLERSKGVSEMESLR